jgi:hypothetical protein
MRQHDHIIKEQEREIERLKIQLNYAMQRWFWASSYNMDYPAFKKHMMELATKTIGKD